MTPPMMLARAAPIAFDGYFRHRRRRISSIIARAATGAGSRDCLLPRKSRCRLSLPLMPPHDFRSAIRRRPLIAASVAIFRQAVTRGAMIEADDDSVMRLDISRRRHSAQPGGARAPMMGAASRPAAISPS